MARRHRDRKPARRKPFRPVKPIILIVCEGKNTEPDYFRGLAAHVRNPRVEIKLEGGLGTPKTLVESAKRFRDDAMLLAERHDDENLAYDSVWCVFDRDDHLDIPDAYQMARANRISIAFSNPCFELWLILHYRDQPGMMHRDKLAELLREHVSKYDLVRKQVNFADYASGYSNALRRASQMAKTLDDRPLWDRNPYTDVHELVLAILEPAAEPPPERMP